MTGTVLVSGGSGYIAGYLIRQLVAEGWTVRTTIRSLAKETQVRKTLVVDDGRLSFFAADLNDDTGWAEAMAGCSHVAHVASPFPSDHVRDAQDLIRPARDGALRALRAAKEAGVRRFVMTSSAAATIYGHASRARKFTEADWSVLDSPEKSAYTKSKTIAERAARDWIAAEGGGMEYVSINPTLVLGPVWSADYSTSVEVIKKLLTGALPGFPNLTVGIVDVRDVADLHVRALTQPGLSGERFLASLPFMSLREIGTVLRDRMGPEARKVPTRNLPDFLVRLSALFDPMVRQVTGELSKPRDVDASHTREVLGWTPRPAAESIIDTARSLIDLGLVKV